MSVTEKDREAARSTLLAYVEDNRHFEPTVEAIAAAIARAREQEREAARVEGAYWALGLVHHSQRDAQDRYRLAQRVNEGEGWGGFLRDTAAGREFDKLRARGNDGE